MSATNPCAPSPSTPSRNCGDPGQDELELAAAEATARAARARARALKLRAQSETAGTADTLAAEAVSTRTARPKGSAGSEGPHPVGGADTGQDETRCAAGKDVGIGQREEPGERPVAGFGMRRLMRPCRPSRRTVVAAIVPLASCVAVAASGWMVTQHCEVVTRQHLQLEYTAAAKQAVVTLMSMDFTKPEEGVQRIIDQSTGDFRADFTRNAHDFAAAVEQSKVSMTAAANTAAVRSMTNDSADVLVVATSQVTNTFGAQKESHVWRLTVTVKREAGKLKMAKVEFVI